jgi:hypothetical protein
VPQARELFDRTFVPYLAMLYREQNSAPKFYAQNFTLECQSWNFAVQNSKRRNFFKIFQMSLNFTIWHAQTLPKIWQ